MITININYLLKKKNVVICHEMCKKYIYQNIHTFENNQS